MGLFSRKNKQERAAEDSGRFYSKDDDAAIGERARAKRASNAGGGATRRPGNDPMLPEKKRARRRLVGAIALALAAAVGLPMLLDSGPKPLSSAATVLSAAEPKEAKPDTRLADKERADRAAEKAEKAERDRADRLERERAERAERLERQRADHERIERERAERAEHERMARAERDARADKPVKPKAEDKPAKPHDDAARAIAILEGKPSDKPAEKQKTESGSQRFVLQVAAMSSQEKAAEVQAKLRDAGISSYTQKTSTPSGELIRVRVGPLSREEAEKVRAKLGRLGLSGAMTPV